MSVQNSGSLPRWTLYSFISVVNNAHDKLLRRKVKQQPRLPLGETRSGLIKHGEQGSVFVRFLVWFMVCYGRAALPICALHTLMSSGRKELESTAGSFSNAPASHAAPRPRPHSSDYVTIGSAFILLTYSEKNVEFLQL